MPKRSLYFLLVCLLCQLPSIVLTQQCGGCEGNCSSRNELRPPCHCDQECRVYGDCCADRPNCGNEITTVGPSRCRVTESNVYYQIGYWMVDGCPDSSPIYFDLCTSDSEIVPPVSSPDGIVYKNMYCAACHNVVNFTVWSYVYNCSDLNEFNLSQCQFLSFKLPNVSAPFSPRQCTPHIASCLSKETLASEYGLEYSQKEYQDLVSNCKAGHYSLVESNDTLSVYRNKHCAICNGKSTSQNFCSSGTGQNTDRFTTLTFILSPDLSGGTEILTSDGTVISQNRLCDAEQVFDPLLNDCRPLFHTISVVNRTSPLTNNTLPQETRDHSSEYHGHTNVSLVEETVNNSYISNALFDCNGSLIALNESEYKDLGNGSVLFRGETFEIELRDSLERPVICSSFGRNGTIELILKGKRMVYPEGFRILTFFGASLSILGSLIILITHSLFSEMRTLSGKLIMNLAAAFLAGDVILVFEIPAIGSISRLCTSVGILTHFFFLARFSWMSVTGFEICRTFYRAFRLRQSSSQHKRKFVIYLLIGWGLPLGIVGITTIINFTTDELVQYGEVLGTCWIQHQTSALIASVVPLAVSLVFNIILSILTAIFLYSVSRHSTPKDTLSKNKFKSVQYIRVYASVLSVMGLTWIVAFVAKPTQQDWAFYLFIILNGTHGFIICIAFVFTKKVGKKYWALIRQAWMRARPRETSEKQATPQQV